MKCLECGVETKNPKFCSLSCSVKTQRRNAPRKDKTKQCAECQQDFQYKELSQRFCSRSCSAKYNNARKEPKIIDKDYGIVRRIRNPGKDTDYVKVCEYCNEEYIASHKHTKQKYCSNKCAGASKKSATVQAWIDDPTTGTFEQGLKRAIRTYLIEQANYQCTQCQWGEINPTTGKAPLEVDHIDGDCYNNRAENLRVLCPNCHSLTPTYKALNKSSRSYRKN